MSRPASVLLFVCLLLTGAAPTAAQDRVREARTVDAFTEVALSVPGTLHLRQGEPRSVEVEATQKVLDHLKTTVDGGRLEIRDASNFFDRMFGGDDEMEGKVDVYVTTPTIKEISLAGSGRVQSETPIENSSLSLENAGSGTIELEVKTTDLRISIAGSGTFDLRGTAESTNVDIAGSGTIRGTNLTTATAEISVTGSGDTRLHVTDRLSAKIMGSGDVKYRGSPTVDTSILGSGEVRSVEE